MSLEKMLQRAILLQQQNRMADAEDTYKEILRAFPRHLGPLLGLASLYRRQGQAAQAVPLLREVTRLAPAHRPAWTELAAVYGILGRHAEMIAALEAALATAPGDPGARLSLAHGLQLAGRPEEALKHYQAVLAVAPNGQVHSFAALALQSLGRIEEAARHLRTSIDLEPTVAATHYNLGNVLWALNRRQEALDSYTRAVALNPRFAEAYNNLGNVQHDLGMSDKAEASFRAAIALKPDLAAAYNGLGNALQSLQRRDESLAAYQTSVELNPANADGHHNLGILLHIMGRTDAAITHFTRAAEHRPGYAETHYNLGTLLHEQGRHDEAIPHLRTAVRLRPGHVEALNNLGNALNARDKPDEAQTLFEEALRFNGEYASAHYNLGITLQKLNREEDAIGHYRRALALDPGNSGAYNNLGNALEALGQRHEAEQAFVQSLSIDPSPSVYLNLCNVHDFAVGDPQLAALLALAEHGQTMPEKDRAALHFALGKAFADLGQNERAFSHLLQGNALKRRAVDYDEDAALAALAHIASSLGREQIARYAAKGCASPLPIFVVGMPRSGTTLVEQILASHGEVHGAGELTALHDAAGCHDSDRAALENLIAALRRGESVDLCAIGQRYVDQLRRIAPGASRVVDKQPFNFVYAGLIHMALPEAKIVHVRRDPLDTCLSCFSKLFNSGQEFAYDLGELGHYYAAYERLMAHWRDVLPGDVLIEVVYEDVVADLEGQARRLLSYCGLAWDPRCLSFFDTPRAVRTASASQVRKPVYASAIGRWRAYAPHLGPLITALGRSTS